MEREYTVRYNDGHGCLISVFDHEKFKTKKYTLDEAKAVAKALAKSTCKNTKVYKGKELIEEINHNNTR